MVFSKNSGKIFLKNKEFYGENQQLFKLRDNHHNIDYFISAAFTTDIFYIANKHLKDKEKKRIFKSLFEIVSIAGVDETPTCVGAGEQLRCRA